MPRKEDEVYSLRYLQQLYQNQYSAVSGEMNRSLEYLGQLNEAQKTMENVNSVKGKDTLLDLGAGVYMSANVKKSDSVLVNIGGSYLTEKSIDEAKLMVATRIEKMNTLFNKLVKNRNELRDAIVEVTRRLEELTRK